MYKNPLYRVEYRGEWSTITTYIRHEDINAVAKYLNGRIKLYPKEKIINVHHVNDYDDKKGTACFLGSEYGNQKFIETFEERLLEVDRIEKLLV